MTGNPGTPTRFVILAASRTGSNMLCAILDWHPAVLCHHELFNPTGIYYALPLRDGDFSLGTLPRCMSPVSSRTPATFAC